MIGDTPQPGETPRSESDPWSFADPDAAWWRGETDPPSGRPRHPRRRPAAANQDQQTPGGTGVLQPPATKQYAGEAAQAHAAAAQDVAGALDPTAPPRPAADLTAPADAAALTPPAEPVEGVIASVAPPTGAVAEFIAAERDHDRPDPHRYDPLRPTAGHTPRRTAATVAADASPTIAPEPPTAAVTPVPTTPVTTPQPPATTAADSPTAGASGIAAAAGTAEAAAPPDTATTAGTTGTAATARPATTPSAAATAGTTGTAATARPATTPSAAATAGTAGTAGPAVAAVP
ncbi:hypothetical protein AB0J83_26205, partial [Actinoplanes sp. NPDC049596]